MYHHVLILLKNQLSHSAFKWCPVLSFWNEAAWLGDGKVLVDFVVVDPDVVVVPEVVPEVGVCVVVVDPEVGVVVVVDPDVGVLLVDPEDVVVVVVVVVDPEVGVFVVVADSDVGVLVDPEVEVVAEVEVEVGVVVAVTAGVSALTATGVGPDAAPGLRTVKKRIKKIIARTSKIRPIMTPMTRGFLVAQRMANLAESPGSGTSI